MATYYVRGCGHFQTRDPWGKGQAVPLKGNCDDCNHARIGQEIAFIRFGVVPKEGKSKNFRDGYLENGVSVYELGEDGQPVLHGWHYEITKRQPYYGRGVIVGFGSDGEPLVKIKSIRKAAQPL